MKWMELPQRRVQWRIHTHTHTPRSGNKINASGILAGNEDCKVEFVCSYVHTCILTYITYTFKHTYIRKALARCL